MHKCLVVLTLLFSCINASFALDGLGTEASPWLIKSITDFNVFAENSTYWNDYTRLDTNIDLTGRTYTAAPIAPDGGLSFTGTFNGNDHAISNLTISGGANYLGLFGKIDNGLVKNLVLENVVISGTGYFVGALCGLCDGAITNCYSTVSITGCSCVGGLCGYNYGNITNCYSAGTVTGTINFVGGLCGSNYSGSITSCYSTGAVTGGGPAGGLCGCNYFYGTITSCYSTSLVTGIGDYVGGLCGFNGLNSTINFSYSSGMVNSTGDYAGGLCGDTYNSTITSCYFLDTAGPDNGLGTPLTDAQMRQQAGFLGWDFVDKWIISGSGGYPLLTWQEGIVRYDGGLGTQQSPYQIHTTQQLLNLANYPEDYDKYFILTADIDLSPYVLATALIAPDNDPEAQYLQGTPFTGSFDGDGHKISGLTINASETNNSFLGLFGQIESTAIIQNLGVENVSITAGNNTQLLGSLAGYIHTGSTISNCYTTGFVSAGANVIYIGGLTGANNGHIDDCYAMTTVSGGGNCQYLGGLTGYNASAAPGNITNCYSTGTVTGNYSVGGLCGYNYSGNITSCYSTGSVTGDNRVGGLCGYGRGGSITSCYSIGTVIGDAQVGGLCGINDGTITISYSTGTVTGDFFVGGLCGYSYGSITNCYSSGTVNGGEYVGGLCGQNWDGSITSCYSTGAVTGSEAVGGLCGQNDGGGIGYSFWDMDTSSQTTSSGGTGKTTSQMHDINTFLFANWNFVNTWDICDGTNYPRFTWQILSGDVSCPVGVTLVDFAVFSQAWLTSSGQPGYNDDCDLTDDNTINLADLTLFAENFLHGL